MAARKQQTTKPSPGAEKAAAAAGAVKAKAKAKRKPAKRKTKKDQLAEQPGLIAKFDQLLRGRPTEYRPEHLAMARKLGQLGATDLDLAQAFGVEVRTIYRWKVDYPEFAEAVAVGKELADHMVEQSLFKRAVGYTIDEEQIVQAAGVPIAVTVLKHIPPDVKAQTFWLKNRKKDEWRERHDHNLGVQPDNPLATFLADVSGKSFAPVAEAVVAAAEIDPEADEDDDVPDGPGVAD